jgi:ABC-type uncharacterized transport system permease subunit
MVNQEKTIGRWRLFLGSARQRYVLRRLLKQFIAVVVGNIVYFFLLMPRLPARGQHQPFRIDVGLLLDVWVCLVVYGIVELIDRKWMGGASASRGKK